MAKSVTYSLCQGTIEGRPRITPTAADPGATLHIIYRSFGDVRSSVDLIGELVGC